LLILGEHVTTDQGTGAVHTAPGHGQEDFQVGQHYGLEVLCPVLGNGVFTDDTGVVGGQHIWKANALLVAAMRDNGSLLAHADFEHSYPHCWRHKTPTAFRVTPQWFIAMDHPGKQGKTLREQALAAIDQVRWVPDWGKARIHGMVENRPDWCISRQRTWGVPIPLLINKQTGALHPDAVALVRQVADMVAEEGIDVWYEDDIVTRLGQDAETWQPVQDILDVWFDSGSSHFAVLQQRPELQRPADLYLEGSDQHRGWFQTSLLNSVGMYGDAPYRQVLTHGFTVDADGRKMSKSLGNVIAPQQVMNTLGADILRLWVSGADYRQEMTVSDEILKRIGDAYRRIRNTSRFLLGNLADFTADQLLPPEQMLPLDRWAVDRARQTQQQIIQAYDDYQFHNVYQRMHQFCIVNMGGFYLDVIKDRLYTMPRDSIGRRSAQTAMWHIIEAMVRWMAPILCFTAEEIWQTMSGERSRTVLLQTWYQGLDDFAIDAQEQARWQAILQLRDPLRKRIEALRREQNTGNSLAYAVDLYANGDLLKMLREMADELHFLFITARVNVHALADADNGDALERVELDDGHLLLKIQPSKAARCVRCWHHCDSVGSIADHPDICARCHSNVCAEGETRRWG
jgi:isoleucyl-tRNA synthetase